MLQENSTQALPLGAGSITFAAGAATATLSIDPTADTKVELDETLILQLAVGTGYRLGTTGAVTGTILNDDPTGPVVNPGFADRHAGRLPAAALEDGPGTIVFTFTRTGSTACALTVSFGAARDASTAPSVAVGGDFENMVSSFTGSFASGGSGTTGSLTIANAGSVVIKAGQSSATLTLDPKADVAVEADKSLYLTLTASANYNLGTPGRVAGSILNDDFAAGTDTSLPSITLSLPTASGSTRTAAATSSTASPARARPPAR